MMNIIKAGIKNSFEQKLVILFFIPAIIFVITAWIFGTRADNLFQLPALFTAHPLPVILFALIYLGIAVFRPMLPGILRENAPGILLAGLFFAGYLILGSILNTQGNFTNNVFFAADHGSWQGRLVSNDLWAFGLRAVHPFSFLIIRPFVAMVSLTTGGNVFFAALIVLSAAGAASVYIIWKILAAHVSDQYYAIGFASLFGLSASHLLFSSIFESYAFSALFLTLFLLLAANTSRPIWVLMVAGALTFGITVTNFAQNLIFFFFVQKRRRIFSAVMLMIGMLLIALVLNFANNQIYGSNTYFFSSGNVASESKNIQLPTTDHLTLLAQDMFFFNITAPQPHFRGQFSRLRFNFATDGFDYFTPVGIVAVTGWIILLGLSIWQFIRSFDLGNQRTMFSLAMLMCLSFNYALHILYGVEPFLYTADWTYALVLFVAFNMGTFAPKIWFKISFLAFLGLMLINNGWFIYFIISLLKKNIGLPF